MACERSDLKKTKQGGRKYQRKINIIAQSVISRDGRHIQELQSTKQCLICFFRFTLYACTSDDVYGL